MQTLLQGIKKLRPPPSSSLRILPSSSGYGSGTGGPQELGRLPVRTVALRAEHRAAPVGPAQLWGAGSRQPSPSPPFPNPGPRHGAWPGTESQSCCNVKQTWQQEPAAPGTSPLAIFSCFSRETRLMQPACESRGSVYCSTQHLHLLDGMVAPG